MNTSRLLIAAAVLRSAGATAHSADKTDQGEKNEARLAEDAQGPHGRRARDLHSGDSSRTGSK